MPSVVLWSRFTPKEEVTEKWMVQHIANKLWKLPPPCTLRVDDSSKVSTVKMACYWSTVKIYWSKFTNVELDAKRLVLISSPPQAIAQITVISVSSLKYWCDQAFSACFREMNLHSWQCQCLVVNIWTSRTNPDGLCFRELHFLTQQKYCLAQRN